MKKTTPLPSHYSQRGLALMEVLVAILIFSFGILGVVGLQAAMIKNTSEANYRAEATAVIQKRLGAMWVDQANLAMYAEEDTDISASSGLPNGKRTTTRGAGTCAGDLSCFIVTVTWQAPGGDAHNVTTVARVTGG